MRNGERTSRSGRPDGRGSPHDAGRSRNVDGVLRRSRRTGSKRPPKAIMARLDSKRLLERAREGKTDFYRAVYTRDRYADPRAQAEVDSIVDQFGELALGHFARQMAQLDPQRRRALQRLARKK